MNEIEKELDGKEEKNRIPKGNTLEYSLYLICQELYISPIWVLLMMGNEESWEVLCYRYYKHYEKESQSNNNPIQVLTLVLKLKECPTLIKEFLIQNELAIISTEIFDEKKANHIIHDLKKRYDQLVKEQNKILQNIFDINIDSYWDLAEKVGFPTKILFMIANYEKIDKEQEQQSIKFSKNEVDNIFKIYSSKKQIFKKQESSKPELKKQKTEDISGIYVELKQIFNKVNQDFCQYPTIYQPDIQILEENITKQFGKNQLMQMLIISTITNLQKAYYKYQGFEERDYLHYKLVCYEMDFLLSTLEQFYFFAKGMNDLSKFTLYYLIGLSCGFLFDRQQILNCSPYSSLFKKDYFYTFEEYIDTFIDKILKSLLNSIKFREQNEEIEETKVKEEMEEQVQQEENKQQEVNYFRIFHCFAYKRIVENKITKITFDMYIQNFEEYIKPNFMGNDIKIISSHDYRPGSSSSDIDKADEDFLKSVKNQNFQFAVDFSKENYKSILTKNYFSKIQEFQYFDNIKHLELFIGVLTLNAAFISAKGSINQQKFEESLLCVSQYLESNKRSLTQILSLFINGGDFNLSCIHEVIQLKPQTLKSFATTYIDSCNYKKIQEMKILLKQTNYSQTNQFVIQNVIELYKGDITKLLDIVKYSKYFNENSQCYKELYKFLNGINRGNLNSLSKQDSRFNMLDLQLFSKNNEESGSVQDISIFEICKQVIQLKNIDRDESKSKKKPYAFEPCISQIIRNISNNNWQFIIEIQKEDEIQQILQSQISFKQQMTYFTLHIFHLAIKLLIFIIVELKFKITLNIFIYLINKILLICIAAQIKKQHILKNSLNTLILKQYYISFQILYYQNRKEFRELFDLSKKSLSLVKSLLLFKPDINRLSQSSSKDQFLSPASVQLFIFLIQLTKLFLNFQQKIEDSIKIFNKFGFAFKDSDNQQLKIFTYIVNKSLPYLVQEILNIPEDEKNEKEKILLQSNRRQLKILLQSILIVKFCIHINWKEIFFQIENVLHYGDQFIHQLTDQFKLTDIKELLESVLNGFDVFSAIFLNFLSTKETDIFSQQHKCKIFDTDEIKISSKINLELFFKLINHEESISRCKSQVQFLYLLKTINKIEEIQTQNVDFKYNYDKQYVQLTSFIFGGAFLKLEQSNIIIKQINQFSEQLLFRNGNNGLFDYLNDLEDNKKKENNEKVFLDDGIIKILKIQISQLIICGLQSDFIKSNSQKNGLSKWIFKSIADLIQQIIQEFSNEKQLQNDFGFLIIELLKCTQDKIYQKEMEEQLVIAKQLLQQFHKKLKEFFKRDFPEISQFLETKIQPIYNAIQKLFDRPLFDLKDQNLQNDVIGLLMAIENKYIDKQFLTNLINLIVQHDFKSLLNMIEYCQIVPQSEFKIIKESILKISELSIFLDRNALSNLQNKASLVISDQVKEINKKIQNNLQINITDMFHSIDNEGDGNGKISMSEFCNFLKRTGIQMSEHRINELFATIKKDRKFSNDQINSFELDFEEFQQAYKYINNKKIDMSLEKLGISPALLALSLGTLITILVLLLVFIFLGIKAFALGGTFGSIINSIIPMVATAGTAQTQSDKKGSLKEENIKDVMKETQFILHSNQL